MNNTKLRWVGISVLAIVLVFIGLEIGLRVFRPYGSPIEKKFPVWSYRHPFPYVMFKWQTPNSWSYPGTAPLIPKPEKEYRILLVGGSTLALGNPPLPELIDKKLRAIKKTAAVRCYNMGVISSVSGMELARITFEAHELKPDLIVMYGGGNDVLQPVTADPRPGYPLNFIAYERNPLVLGSVENYPTLPLALYGSYLFRLVFPNYFLNRLTGLDETRKQAGYGTDHWQDEILKSYISNLQKAQLVSKAYGAEFLAVYQPLLFYKKQLSVEENKIPYIEYESIVANALRPKIQKAFQDLKVTKLQTLDLSGLFENTSDRIYEDQIHINAAGNEILASKLADSLAQIVKH